MKNQIIIFEGTEVEVLELDGVVYFNPYHVGDCLGLKKSAVRMATKNMNSNQAIKLTNSDVKDIDIRKLNNAGENFLTESGVYKLVFRSNKPNAEKFTDWVTDEVLPSIRETGKYCIEENSKPNLMKHKGQPVVTLKEIERVTGNNSHTVSYWLKNLNSQFRERKEYFLLEGNDLKEFKDENKEPMPFVSSLIVIGIQGILRLSKILPNLDKIKSEFECLVEKVKKTSDEKVQECVDYLEQSMTTFSYLVEHAKYMNMRKNTTNSDIAESFDTVLTGVWLDIQGTLKDIRKIQIQ